MQFKIDTKTSYRLIQVDSERLDDNLAEDLSELCADYTESPPGNIILVFSQAGAYSNGFWQKIGVIQEQVYAKKKSMVITGFTDEMNRKLKQEIDLDQINLAPTIIEAVDIISMEVLERDLLEEED